MIKSLLLAAAVTLSTSNAATITYGYRSYSQIVDAMQTLESNHPQFVELFSAQERYGLPLRSELSCTRNGRSEPCQHYVIKITDESTLPEPSRPEVFFSGALHGNERVGPQSAIALAEFLVDHASRADGNPWIKRLVATRTVVIMPTTNAYGYDRNVREERNVDPNRDFPYSKSGSRCFVTMVARAVNEVWRDHIFQLAVTWHGGTRAVSYEWGSNNHALNNGVGSEKSPDDRGQFFAGLGMSRYGGKFEEDRSYYPSGPMNDIVYAVDGGMEDWGYAASWENEFTTPKPIGVCNPTTYGGYSKDKSSYNSATHRAFNILVETSSSKQPSTSSLGNSSPLSDSALADYLPSSTSIGHVPRNVRLALFYIDLVQPYVEYKTVPSNITANESASFTWEVAGSITVDSTQLKYSTKPDMSSANTTSTQSGVTRWYHADMKSFSGTNNKGLFTQSIKFPNSGVYYVQASATVDQNWAEQPESPVPKVAPQTHVVNARTNANWSFSANNKTVAGQLVWKSEIVKVFVVGDNDVNVGDL